MLDPTCVLVWVLKVVWQIREKKWWGTKKRKAFENLKKWIHWSRLKWNDGSKIEFEKIYTEVKNAVEKIKEKYF